MVAGALRIFWVEAHRVLHFLSLTGDLHSAQRGIGQHGVVGINVPIASATDAALSSLERERLKVTYVTPVP